MRILIKGGVWKNTEDEILKAAVMKYGKNQWARVASLLSRKSAKQCKARWYEWLDPSIKKIEWNREEEEKLLHLAKLMPNQWRTIAPIVGRTAGQCMEHYERLLDQVQEEAEGISAAGTDDPRRLRPGEIDPAPETKPARPDPIDMDDDEKEMLAEARARLANTKGKKAKRKARERQLDESRRLSVLQKRRELKAAGIESKLGGPSKRKYIDYSREIPFQHVAPAGFYDVGDEIVASKNQKIDPVSQGMELSKLEGRHEREEEERERNKDKKRLKTLFKANAPETILRIAEQADPTSLRKRAMLSLPAPQVSDIELEDIVKAGQSAMALMPPPESGSRGKGVATSALLGDYSAQFKGATPTPLRTPVQENIVMQEARNLRILRDMTPLAGDELPELQEGTGFEGMKPRNAKLATPNSVLGTPARGGPGSTPVIHTPGSVTSSFGGSVAGGSKQLLLRDQLGLNDPHADSFSVSDVESVTSFASRGQERERKQKLANQLKQLPEPEFVYEIAVPELGGEDTAGDGDNRTRREDAADRAERLRAEREREAELVAARRSTVLKRGLPRPVLSSSDVLESLTRPSVGPGSSQQETLASGLINEEMVRMLLFDEATAPNIEGAASSSATKRGRGEIGELLTSAKDQFEVILDEDLAAGRALLAAECEGSVASADVDVEDTVWEDLHRKYMYIPTGDNKGSFAVPSSKAEVSEW